MRNPPSPAPLGAAHLVADLGALGPAATGIVARLLEAGLGSLSLRGKGVATGELVERGGELARRARDAGALFVVNEDLEAARRLGADGVHLPAARADIAAARRALPAGALVGVSAHDEFELDRAADADWVFVSPVWPTASKPGARGLGADGLARLVRLARPPVWALGGVDASRVAECFAAGASGVAAIRALLGPDGPALVAAAREEARRRFADS